MSAEATRGSFLTMVARFVASGFGFVQCFSLTTSEAADVVRMTLARKAGWSASRHGSGDVPMMGVRVIGTPKDADTALSRLEVSTRCSGSRRSLSRRLRTGHVQGLVARPEGFGGTKRPRVAARPRGGTRQTIPEPTGTERLPA